MLEKTMSSKSFLDLLYSAGLKMSPKNDFGDRLFSLIRYIKAHKKLPNNDGSISNYLFNLKTGSEALNPLRAYISDKEFVKTYVSGKVGPEFNVPTIAVLHSYEDALAFDFPARCCVKPTHLSGEVILRENSEDIDYALIKRWFDTNYYNSGREKNYRHLKPKLIIEPLIFDATDNEDFKFFCFNGKAKFIQIDIGRTTKHQRLYFDRAWHKQDFSIVKPQAEGSYNRPENLEKMLSVADALSSDFSFIRVDLYTNGDEIYVGELTNWPENGNSVFIPKSSEDYASRLLFDD